MRGCGQIVAMGFALGYLLRGAPWVVALAFFAMALAAAAVAAGRLQGLPGRHLVCAGSVAAGSAACILGAAATGILETETSTLLPVGSMILATCMNAVAQSLERFLSDLRSHVREIEAALMLGASPKVAVARFGAQAVKSGILQQVNALSSLGIVWIPGLMAGMVLSGRSPVEAALLQFSVIALLVFATAVSSVCAVALARAELFSVGDRPHPSLQAHPSQHTHRPAG